MAGSPVVNANAAQSARYIADMRAQRGVEGGGERIGVLFLIFNLVIAATGEIAAWGFPDEKCRSKKCSLLCSRCSEARPKV